MIRPAARFSRAQLVMSVASSLWLASALVGCTDPTPPGAPDWTPNREPSAWSFDDQAVGGAPAGWRTAETNGHRTPAKWVVSIDPDAPSTPNIFRLAETTNSGSTFNIAIAEGSVYQDFDLTLKMRPLSGSEDRGGGPLWRCIDENNYYVCRFNPLEDNFRVYKVIQGKRRQLGSARVDVPSDTWVEVGVSVTGSQIVCSLNGKKLLDVTDDTLPSPGRVGLWTKADAASEFDDIRVIPR